MNKIISFTKKQPVLVISFLIAFISIFFIPPDRQYIDYCNFSVLIQLFCLMITVSGFRSIGVFEYITHSMLKKTGNIRRLSFLLMNLCFFSSMLVTNDVALLTFVPLTLMLFQDSKDYKSIIKVIVIETAAANLGSMMTPVGNPQNLYLYAEYNMTSESFIKIMLPSGIISYIMLTVLCFLMSSDTFSSSVKKCERIPKVHLTAYILMFAVCLLAVFRKVPDYICLIAAIILFLILDRKMFKKVDYALLMTFICFFIFVGNIARVEMVRDFFNSIIQGNELIVSALLSQVISNVPASVMLSGFTDNVSELMLGVNIGGLGTPIASLASLISYQFYAKSENANSKKYLVVFSAVNFSMLIVLLIFTMITQYLSV